MRLKKKKKKKACITSYLVQDSVRAVRKHELVILGDLDEKRLRKRFLFVLIGYKRFAKITHSDFSLNTHSHKRYTMAR